MYATTFEFDGIKSEDVGFYILNFDGFSNDGVGVAGNEITFNISKPPNLKKWNFHGSKYETQLTFDLQIGKINCKNNKCSKLSNGECDFLLRWLVRSDGYKFLRIYQNEFEDTYFNAQITLQWIRIQGKIVGAQLSVTCDAPFGYSAMKNYEIECADGGSFQIYNDSDEVGAIIFDEVNILMTSDAKKLQIKNDMEALYSPLVEYTTVINNLKQGENIIIANRQIATNQSSHNIIDDFNLKYPRLIYLSSSTAYNKNNNYPTYQENRINTYTVTGGSCHLLFNYRTTKKVLP